MEKQEEYIVNGNKEQFAKFTVYIEDCIIVKTDDIVMAFDFVMKDYQHQEICITEYLDSIFIKAKPKDALCLIGWIYNQIENDKIVRINEEDKLLVDYSGGTDEYND